MSGLSTNSVDSTLAAVRSLMKEIGIEDEAASGNILAVGKTLTIAQAADMKRYWQPYVEAEDMLVIEAGEVEEIDTAGMQLLLALVFGRAVQGRLVSWGGVSDQFRQVAMRLGLANELGIA